MTHHDAKTGRPCPIFDCHTHAFPDKLAGKAIPGLEAEALWEQSNATFDGTVGGLLSNMDQAGISRAILCSVATKPEQSPRITDWSAQVASDRVIPFASIHPAFPDIEAEVQRVAALGLKGLKMHPYYMNCPLDDERSVRLARAAAKAGLAIMYHSGHDIAFPKNDIASPERMRRLHKAVPDLRMCAAHLGAWRQWEDVRRILAGLPIYFETSYTFGQCPEGLMMEILEVHPREYLMFGTDAPWRDQKDEVRLAIGLPMTDDFKRGYLWENAHRFAGLPC